VIDTSVMPQLTVHIEFTQLPVATVSSGIDPINAFTNMMALSTSNYSYEVNDAYAMIEVISAGPIYDQMQQRLMASKGYIPYAFKRFSCFDGGQGETTVRFQVNSQSVDWIYACSIDYTPTAGVVLANSGLPTDGSENGLTAEMYSTRALRSRVNPGPPDGNYTNGPQGLDTRNMALDGLLNAGEMGGLDYPGTGLGVWVESTAELRVMPGRKVQLVP
jgi:hypothetical protein